MAGLKFRVLLDSAEGEIFRDILIADNDHFESFYREIMRAYGFKGDEMASFYVSNVNWDKGQEIALHDLRFGDDADEDAPLVMNESNIREHITDPQQRLILVHDFIRMWIFLIELIEIVKTQPENPQTVLSVGQAPGEHTRTGNEELQFEAEEESEDDEDDYGFDDFEDGFDPEDYDYYE